MVWKTNVILISGIILLFIFISISSLQAQEQKEEKIKNQDAEIEAGITPDSIFWELDRAIEKIQLLLTFDVIEKAKLRLKIANERLAEIEVMIAKNKTEEAEIAKKAREIEISKLRDLNVTIPEKTPEKARADLTTNVINEKVLNKSESEPEKEEIEKAEEVEEAKEEEKGATSAPPPAPAIGVPYNRDLDTEGYSAKNASKDGEQDGGFGYAITVPYNTDPAPEWILNRAKQHIVSYVGEEYYNEHIFIRESETKQGFEKKPGNDKIGAKYRIYYTYEFKIRDDINEASMGFTLWLDPKGNLAEYRGIKYRGPAKPYIFNISKSEAERIAKENGLPESATTTIKKGGKLYDHTKPTTISIQFGLNFVGVNESYIWYASTQNYQGGKPSAVYIDVDSGEVLGKYFAIAGGWSEEVLSEEQKAWIEELIRKEHPYILERMGLYSAEEVVGEPNQLKLKYTNAFDFIDATVIVDLEKKKIISVK